MLEGSTSRVLAKLLKTSTSMSHDSISLPQKTQANMHSHKSTDTPWLLHLE